MSGKGVNEMEDFYFCADCEEELENPDISMAFDGEVQRCEECGDAEVARRRGMFEHYRKQLHG